MLTRRISLLSLALACTFSSTAWSQETKAGAKVDASAKSPSTATTPAKQTPEYAEFTKTYGEWKQFLAGLADLQNKYQKASKTEQSAIEAEYNKQAAAGSELTKRLKAATEAAFVADPANKEVSELAKVMTVSALNDDYHEEADRLAQLMVDNKVDVDRMTRVLATTAMGLNRFDQVEPLLKSVKGTSDKTGQQLVEDAKTYQEYWAREKKLREAETKADDLPRVKFATSKGDIVIELFENEAPNTVANMISLVEKKFYDGTPFHRVLPHFMAQGGDPTGTGSGGPGHRIKCECFSKDARMHYRGTLSMAHAGRDTGGSQFFLTFQPTSHLNGKHTVFGRIIEGIDVLSRLERIDPSAPAGQTPDKIVTATVIRKRDHEYKPETLPGK